MSDQQKQKNLHESNMQNPATQAKPKTISPHTGFYKSFGRPIAKVFLGAIFTYQVTFLLWTKLESDEIMRQKQSQLVELEAQLKQLSS